jgi:hypothetical protein
VSTTAAVQNSGQQEVNTNHTTGAGILSGPQAFKNFKIAGATIVKHMCFKKRFVIICNQRNIGKTVT